VLITVKVLDSVVLDRYRPGETTPLAARRQRVSLRSTPGLFGVLRTERTLLAVRSDDVSLG
jgi:hypothetical protein